MPIGSTYNDVSPEFHSYGTPSSSFTWATATYPNARCGISGNRTITLTGVADGDNGVLRIVAQGDYIITLSVSGFTSKIDSGAPVTGVSGQIQLSNGSDYLLTYQAMTGLIYFNIVDYNTL